MVRRTEAQREARESPRALEPHLSSAPSACAHGAPRQTPPVPSPRSLWSWGRWPRTRVTQINGIASSSGAMKELVPTRSPPGHGVSTIYSFTRAAITKYHGAVGLNNRKVFSHDSGGCTSNKVSSAGLVSSETSPCGLQKAVSMRTSPLASRCPNLLF